jgi:hypothetical protein
MSVELQITELTICVGSRSVKQEPALCKHKSLPIRCNHFPFTNLTCFTKLRNFSAGKFCSSIWPLISVAYVTVSGPAKCYRMYCRNHLFNSINATLKELPRCRNNFHELFHIVKLTTIHNFTLTLAHSVTAPGTFSQIWIGTVKVNSDRQLTICCS